jgi:dienelactone hydrolase
MTLSIWRLVPVVILLLLASCAVNPVVPGSLVTEQFMLPATFEGQQGSYVVRLDALVIRPDDNRRHPLVVLNHGLDGHALKQTSPREMRALAVEFARRGWVAIAFSRRGYGKSEGRFAEGVRQYTAAEYERVARSGASDIREVIRLMAEQPYVDPTRVLSVGVSAGGFATVGLSADPPPGLVAAVNLAGGQASYLPSGTGFVVNNEAALIEAFTHLGHTSRLPMLWIYSVNDSHFNPTLVHQLFKGFNGAGGHAQFVEDAAWNSDGHSLFGRAFLSVWMHDVDAFLAAHDLKLQDGLIAFDDDAGVTYPPHMNPKSKSGFLDYLDAGDHKAFAMSPALNWKWVSKSPSTDVAIKQALEGCVGCSIVSVDGQAP